MVIRFQAVMGRFLGGFHGSAAGGSISDERVSILDISGAGRITRIRLCVKAYKWATALTFVIPRTGSRIRLRSRARALTRSATAARCLYGVLASSVPFRSRQSHSAGLPPGLLIRLSVSLQNRRLYAGRRPPQLARAAHGFQPGVQPRRMEDLRRDCRPPDAALEHLDLRLQGAHLLSLDESPDQPRAMPFRQQRIDIARPQPPLFAVGKQHLRAIPDRHRKISGGGEVLAGSQSTRSSVLMARRSSMAL